LDVVTGRERFCTAFARERRWSETDLKSNEGVEESDGEDAEGVETLGGNITGGVEEDGRVHLVTGGATQMMSSSSDGSSSSSDAGSLLEDTSSGIRAGIGVQIVAF
jgi:hypothetical protein